MRKKRETNHKCPLVLRLLTKLLYFIFRIVALVLAAVIFFSGICICITGSVTLVDIIKNNGGQYYRQLELFVKDTAEDLVERRTLTHEQYALALVEAVENMAARQQETDDLLLAELHSGAYTADAPFVLVDPYGNSPLAALVLFQTEEPSRVSVHIAGDTRLAEVDYTFSDYNTDHSIPIYGLYAQRENPVTITVTSRNGAVQTTDLLVSTDVLPAKLENDIIRAHVLDEDAYQSGFTFTYMGNNSDDSKAALDANGAHRWVLDMSAYGQMEANMGYCANYNNSDSIFVSCGSRGYGPVAILEMNYLGKLLGAWYAPYGAHHDIMITENNTVLVTGSTSTDVIEDMLYEIDLETGEIICTLDYADVLQIYRDQTQDYPEIDYFYALDDWFHMNTIEVLNDDLIVSGRHQSTVVCNDREGNIKWMLCDPTDYYEYYQQFILTPVGNNFEYSYIQHAPEVMPDQDGNPDTVDILMFDNGDFRKNSSEIYSRMVQYRINEKEMTVEQIWSYGGDRTELYSYRHGDADLLENGNRLGSFEPYDEKFDIRWAYGIEVTAEGEPVWECWRMSAGDQHEYSEYRLERLEIYSEGANDLHLGEAARLFLPEI